MGTHELVGALVAVESTHPRIEAMAVRRADGTRALLLINKASGPLLSDWRQARSRWADRAYRSRSWTKRV